MKLPIGPGFATLPEIVHFQARKQRQGDALLAPGCGPLTYGQLAGQVDHVGHVLRAHGIERSDRVAVVLPNGPAMAAAFLGIAAHAACAPLNPSYRRDEIEFYLRDLRARAMVVPAGMD